MMFSYGKLFLIGILLFVGLSSTKNVSVDNYDSEATPEKIIASFQNSQHCDFPAHENYIQFLKTNSQKARNLRTNEVEAVNNFFTRASFLQAHFLISKNTWLYHLSHKVKAIPDYIRFRSLII
jgi:hypothetical protein